jgi:hypothetical protein
MGEKKKIFRSSSLEDWNSGSWKWSRGWGLVQSRTLFCYTKLVRSTRRAVTPEYCTRVFNEESDYFHPAFGFFHAECDVCGTDLWQVPHESPEDALREDFQAELLILLRGAGVVNHDDGTTGLPVDAIMAQLADSPYAPTQYTADAIGGLLDALQDRNWLFQDDDGDGNAMIFKI